MGPLADRRSPKRGIRKVRWWLLLPTGVLAALLVSGAITFHHTQEEHGAYLWIVHWIPDVNPARLLVRPPYQDGLAANLESFLDMSLEAKLREYNVCGELRLLDRIPINEPGRNKNCVILLRNQPTLPITLGMTDSETTFYMEGQASFTFFPSNGIPLNKTMTIAPSGAHPAFTEFIIQNKNNTVSKCMTYAVKLVWW